MTKRERRDLCRILSFGQDRISEIRANPAINSTHVNILTLLAPSGIRQKLWSLRLIVIMGRPGSKATMEGEMLPEIVENSPVGDMA